MSELRDAVAQAIRTAGDPDADGRAAAEAVLVLVEQHINQARAEGRHEALADALAAIDALNWRLRYVGRDEVLAVVRRLGGSRESRWTGNGHAR